MGKAARALIQPCHYRAFFNMVRVYPNPAENLRRYLTGSGSYPYQCRVRTPLGEYAPILYDSADLLTVNEIFCRHDYPAGPDTRTVVDIGSNIGISALFFLTRHPDARCYLFEPDPRNVVRLHDNLSAFSDRYDLSQAAVGPTQGVVEFGTERTGRYGAVGLDGPGVERITVDCTAINSVLNDILERESSIDILKLDIEGLEVPTVRAIEPELLRDVRAIHYEASKEQIVTLSGFDHHYSCETHHLIRTSRSGSRR